MANVSQSVQHRCVVLGGRGFIGSHLVDRLLSDGHFVRCVDRSTTMAFDDTHGRYSNFEFVSRDFSSDGMGSTLEGCDICFHLISTTIPSTSNIDPIFDLRTNLLSTVSFLQNANYCGVQKIVFVSSGGTVYGEPEQVPIDESHPTNPSSSYGITKLAIEKYLHLFNHLYALEYDVLRLSNPFGERQRTQASQGAVAVFLSRTLNNEPIEIWGDGSIVRDYIYIGDVVSALVACMDSRSKRGRVFNIGSGQGRTLLEVLASIEKVTGRVAVRTHLTQRKMDASANILSIARARRELNWAPAVSFEDGVRRFAEYLVRTTGKS